MLREFQELVEELKRLDWSRPELGQVRVEELLRRVSKRPDLLVKEVQSWRGADLEARAERSHETSTHHKWFVAKDHGGRFTVWLHQYKPARYRRSGYAEVPHNHRYWFCSCVLSGGFTHLSYEVANSSSAPIVTVKEVQRIITGTVYSVGPEMVHALGEIQEGTLTLVVQAKPIRQYSEVYDPDRGTKSRYYDFVGQLDLLEGAVAGLVPASHAAPGEA